ncbi:MAG TPA: hypothetical protein P5513_05895 [Candidatus Diapherotrites archaeon]|nr:hypothetical protein [Candidatus Diapherotrites archaeon]
MKKIVKERIEDVLASLKKDRAKLGLNKKIVFITKDEGGNKVKVCSVNGDFIRDNNPGLDFIEFVDGGHHYVTSYPGYKKYIPEDEIWIDDVFLMKPNDFHAIFIHEFTERNLQKYHNNSYDYAHDMANIAERKFGKKEKYY